MKSPRLTRRSSAVLPADISVLIVDDDEDDRLLIGDLLRSMDPDIHIDEATRADSAEAIALQRIHDVILVDYRLGGADGVELIHRLMERPDPPAPAILLTGFDDGGADAGALAAGAMDFLSKEGLDASVLGRSIRYAVEAWRIRKRLEAEGRRYRSIFGEAPIGMAVVSLDLRIQETNRSLRQMLGASESDLSGRLITDFIHPDDVERGLGNLRTKAGGADAASVEIRYLRDDGKEMVGSTRFALVRDDSRAPSYLLAQIADVTAERAAEARVHLQQRLLEEVRNAVIATDTAGKVSYWSRHAEVLYGWSAEEATGRSLEEVTVPVATEGSIGELLAIVDRDGAWEGEREFYRRDGSRFPAHISIATVRDLAGEPIGTVGVSFDLTETKEARAEARQRDEVARAVLDAVGFPTAVVDSEGVIIGVNRAWEMFALANGGSLETTGIGVSYLEVCDRSGRDAMEIADRIRGVLAGQDRRFEHEYPCHSPVQQRWYRMEVAPVPGVGAVISHFNITEQRQARQVLEKELMEKDRFIASVGHELRTPLTAVLGFAELLADDVVTDSGERQDIISSIVSEARDVALIVEDLLVAARADLGVLQVDFVALDIEREVRKLLRSLGRSGHPNVELEVEGEVRNVRSDAARIRQIVRNLVINAFRYGGDNVRAVLRFDAPWLVISVEDDGEGVPHGLEESIFDSYRSAHQRPGLTDAVGLGLAVARMLARLLGGDVTYRRRDGWSVFELRLPTDD